jgi:pyruvate kinase
MVLSVSDTKTKIVCTMGPATEDLSVLRRLIREGMDVARVNFSHGRHEEHRSMIERVREAAQQEGAVIAIMADLQGPKIRLGELTEPIELSVGDWVCLTSRSADGTHNVLPLPHPEIIAYVQTGQRLLLDDGAVELVVEELRPEVLICRVSFGGVLSSNKGVALPEGIPAQSAMTDKDHVDAAFAVSQGVDFIALSFVRSPEDIEELRQLLQLQGEDAAGIAILAKIESRCAVERFHEILPRVDAVMVARGDLGVELSPQTVPLHQKEIIQKCNHAGIPVITATQMLQSMIESPRPTRAEASDVANAILDGSDAVMLSAETAIGRYPVEAVSIIREISSVVEERMLKQMTATPGTHRLHAVTDAISDATVQIATDLQTRLIVTATWSGYTARQIARMRPRQAIVALTPQPTVHRQLALVWGVSPVLVPSFDSTEEMLQVAERMLIERDDARPGDWIVLTGGLPVGGGGKTNFLKVHQIARP